MKIRNGFVSNSSSSSFILTYNKDKVTHNPEEVYNLIIDQPNIEMVFSGGNYSEGDDIFLLDVEHKKAIRKFKDEFIKNNTGTCIKTVYDSTLEDFVDKEQPKITVYYGEDSNLIYDNKMNGFGYGFDVDMSDIQLFNGDSLSTSEYLELPEDKKQESNEYYRIKNLRERQAYMDYVKNKLEELKHDNVEAKTVDVDYRNCGDDIYEFRSRYISLEDSDAYDNITRHHIDEEESIYTLVYEKYLTNKEDIKKALESKAPNCYIARYEDSLEDAFNIDFYEVGDKELEYLLKDNALIWKKSTACKLFVGLHIFKNGDSIENLSGKINTYSGRIAVIKSGQDLKDFVETFYEEEE